MTHKAVRVSRRAEWCTLVPAPLRFDESSVAQLAEVMTDGRFRHAHHLNEVGNGLVVIERAQDQRS